MGEPLPCVEVVDPERAIDAAVVWLHGLGADGHDFEPIVPELLAAGCRGIRFVFPHAQAMPVTINGGMVMPAWYDITSLEHAEGRENAEHIAVSARRIEALLEREIARGIAPGRIVLAGFSQGAAMVLHVAPRFEHTLAGVVCLSGYHVLPARFEAERTLANRATPLFFGHGLHDPLVPVALGKSAHETFATWSEAATVWHTYPMGHEVCAGEISDLARWLRAALPTTS